MLSLDAIVVGAASILIVSTVGWRWAASPRVQGFPSIESMVVQRVYGGLGDPGFGHVGRVQGPGGRVRGAGAEVYPAAMQVPLFCNSRTIPPPRERGAAFLPATEHVSEFILWASVDEDGQAHRVRFHDKQLVGNYRTWANRLGVVPLPTASFLSMIAKHPQVKRSRERVKDRTTGRVMHLASGSPLRETIYSISPPRKSAGNSKKNLSSEVARKPEKAVQSAPLPMKEAA